MGYETLWIDSEYELDLFQIIRDILMKSKYEEAALLTKKSMDELTKTNWQSIKNGVLRLHSFYFDKEPKPTQDTQQELYKDGYAFVPNIGDIFDKYYAGGYSPLLGAILALREYDQYFKPIKPLESILNPPYIKDIRFEYRLIKSIEVIFPSIKNWKAIDKSSDNKHFFLTL